MGLTVEPGEPGAYEEFEGGWRCDGCGLGSFEDVPARIVVVMSPRLVKYSHQEFRSQPLFRFCKDCAPAVVVQGRDLADEGRKT